MNPGAVGTDYVRIFKSGPVNESTDEVALITATMSLRDDDGMTNF